MTREEAISRLKDGEPFSEIYDPIWNKALKMAISALSEDKGDLISRAEVLKHREILRDDNGTGHQAVKTKYIRELPSVENKGKWIKVDLKGYTEYLWKCNKCKAHHRAMYDFCPSCGADMRGKT